MSEAPTIRKCLLGTDRHCIVSGGLHYPFSGLDFAERVLSQQSPLSCLMHVASGEVAECDRLGEKLLDLASECLDIPPQEGEAICPNCGKWAYFTEHQRDCVETHGLDCGPYERWTERWLTCDKCGDPTSDEEIRATNPRLSGAAQ